MKFLNSAFRPLFLAAMLMGSSLCWKTSAIAYGAENPQSLFRLQKHTAIPQYLSQRIDDDETGTRGYGLIQQAVEQAERWQFRESLVSLERALALFRSIDNRQVEAEALDNMGAIYLSLEQPERAIGVLNQALAIAKDTNNLRGQFFSLGNLGTAYLMLKQYQQALSQYEQMLAVARQHRDGRIEPIIGALTNLGHVYAEWKQPEKALAFYEKTLTLARASAGVYQTELTETAFANLGNAYEELERYEQAIDSFQKALAIARSRGDREREAFYLRDLGRAYLKMQQYKQAEEFLDQSISLLSLIRRASFNDAANIAKLESLQKVSALLQQALVAQGKHERALEVAETGRSRAFAELLSRPRNEDRTTPRKTIPNLERFKAMAQEQQSTLVIYTTENIDPNGESVHAYLDYFLLDIWLISPNGEVTFRQRPISAENLDDLIATTRQAIDIYGAGEGEIPQFKIFRIQEQIRERTQKPAPETQPAPTTEPRTDAEPLPAINFFRTRYVPGIEELVLLKLYDHFSSSIGPAIANVLPSDYSLDKFFLIPYIGAAEKPDLAATQATAQAQQATMVEYSIVEGVQENPVLYIWVVQPSGSIHFRTVDLTQLGGQNTSALTELISGVLKNVTFEYSDTHPAQLRTQLQTLHRLLIDPVANLLPSDPEAKVVFIPQGNLFLIPFAALQDQKGTYLIEKHTILTAPSIQVLRLANQMATKRQTPLHQSKTLIVGNPTMPEVWVVSDKGDFTKSQLEPLLGAKAEAETIGRFLDVTPLIGDRATEARIKQELPSAKLIHLATHGLLDYGDLLTYGTLDLPGAIALAPSRGEDGLLTAAEIMEMTLQAELAVLSACDTGQGRITGDGVVGLSRAFITAGVPSVVVSLWAVPDARTAKLMGEFYRQLDQGQDKAQALRQTMLNAMEEYQHPKSWAAFTLIGSGL